MSTRSMLGLFQQPEPAADAMDGLKEAGFELGSFDVLTGVPYPEGAFGEYVPQHRLVVYLSAVWFSGFLEAPDSAGNCG